MEILTKQQAAEIAYRPMSTLIPEQIMSRCIGCFCKQSQQVFIREFRKTTGLMLCSFAPGMFYIRYKED
jgi:hypothetical protein